MHSERRTLNVTTRKMTDQLPTPAARRVPAVKSSRINRNSWRAAQGRYYYKNMPLSTVCLSQSDRQAKRRAARRRRPVRHFQMYRGPLGDAGTADHCHIVLLRKAAPRSSTIHSALSYFIFLFDGISRCGKALPAPWVQSVR